jgi:hypothetical protein
MRVNNERAQKMRERCEAASDMVRRLCLPKADPDSRDWTMRIPADPTRDPDLIIAAALDDQENLLLDREDMQRDQGVG